MKKRILFVSPFFFPEPISTAKYNTTLVKELLDANCRVDVLCSHPFYPHWKVKKSKDDFPGAQVIRGGSKIKYPGNTLLRRAILEIWFSIFVVRHIIFNRNRYDICISILPPSLFAYFIQLFIGKNIKTISVVHDLQNVYAKKSSGIKGKVLTSTIGFIEKRVLKNCNSIIFLSNTMRDAAEKDYETTYRNSFVSYPFINLSEENKNEDIPLHYLPKDQFNIVYSGAFGEKQNPRVLLDFFQRYTTIKDDTVFTVFSDGPIFEELQQIYKANPKIQFFNLVPQEQILSLYRSSDLQLIPQIEGSNEGSLPSKLPNLLYAGVPILSISEEKGELEKILSDFSDSYTLTTWDFDEFCKVIDMIKDKKGQRSAYQIYQERVQEGKMEKFNIESLINYIISNE